VRSKCMVPLDLFYSLPVVFTGNVRMIVCRPQPGYSFSFSGCGFLTSYHVGVADALIRYDLCFCSFFCPGENDSPFFTRGILLQTKRSLACVCLSNRECALISLLRNVQCVVHAFFFYLCVCGVLERQAPRKNILSGDRTNAIARGAPVTSIMQAFFSLPNIITEE
jgi:hypothetical protein